MAITKDHKELLEEEWYHVRHSGEIPEIALNSSLYFLAEDEDGPQITLCREGLFYLQDAAKQRYLDIILRDITPANRDSTAYRGVLRAICNWRRFKRFCERHQMSHKTIAGQVAEHFQRFLENEILDVKSGARQSCINCSLEDIVSMAVELEISLDILRDDLEPLCLNF